MLSTSSTSPTKTRKQKSPSILYTWDPPCRLYIIICTSPEWKTRSRYWSKMQNRKTNMPLITKQGHHPYRDLDRGILAHSRDGSHLFSQRCAVPTLPSVPTLPFSSPSRRRYPVHLVIHLGWPVGRSSWKKSPPYVPSITSSRSLRSVIRQPHSNSPFPPRRLHHRHRRRRSSSSIHDTLQHPHTQDHDEQANRHNDQQREAEPTHDHS